MPKADETRRLGYRVEGSGALELEGVCRFSESEVACWDSTGKDLPGLKAQIENALNQPNGGSDGLTVRFGRKNRIVVVRREQAVFRGEPMTSLNLQSIGTDPRQGSGYLNLQSETPNFDSNKPIVGHEARIQAFDKDAKETQMRVMVSEPIPGSPEIALRKGASVSFAGCRFTVAAVEKGSARTGPMFNSGKGEGWTVRLAQAGSPSRPASFSVQNDRPLYRDAKGALVAPETYRKWTQEAQRKGVWDFSKSPFQPVHVSGYGIGRDGMLTIVLNTNPKLVKTARLNGSFMRTVDLTGVPLDPR